MQTGYFVIPALQHDQGKLKADLTSTKEFIKPVKVAEKFQTGAELEAEKAEKVEAEKIELEKVEVKKVETEKEETEKEPVLTKTIKPTFKIQGREVARLEDGRSIIHAMITGRIKDQMKTFIPETGDKKCFGTDWLTDMGINTAFIGYARKDVEIAFPELVGTKVIGKDEEGNDILVSKIEHHKWSGET